MKASKELSREVYQEILNRARILDTPLTEIAIFCGINKDTIRNMYKNVSGRFTIETIRKIRIGLARIDNGEYDGRIINRNRKAGAIDERARQRYDDDRAFIDQRCMDAERLRKARIKAAQEAELAKYGKITIGDKHITDTIA